VGIIQVATSLDKDFRHISGIVLVHVKPLLHYKFEQGTGIRLFWGTT